jgi:hypothetical protein
MIDLDSIEWPIDVHQMLLPFGVPLISLRGLGIPIGEDLSGSDASLSKPLDVDELDRVISRLLTPRNR